MNVSLAETESDFRLHEFRAEIEGVASIGLDPEFVEQRERVLRHIMSVAVEDVNAVRGGFDPEIAVLDLARELRDFRAGVWKRRAIVDLQQGATVAFWQARGLLGREQDPPRGVVFLESSAGCAG